jgi:hypothetical protein
MCTGLHVHRRAGVAGCVAYEVGVCCVKQPPTYHRYGDGLCSFLLVFCSEAWFGAGYMVCKGPVPKHLTTVQPCDCFARVAGQLSASAGCICCFLSIATVTQLQTAMCAFCNAHTAADGPLRACVVCMSGRTPARLS